MLSKAESQRRWRSSPKGRAWLIAHPRKDHGDKAAYVAERTAVIDSAKDRPCADCGGSFPRCAMEFDHVRGNKLFNVSEGRQRSMTALLAEIEKCDVVCANCHHVRTCERGQHRGA